MKKVTSWKFTLMKTFSCWKVLSYSPEGRKLMKRSKNILSTTILLAAIISCSVLNVSANSSWIWLTKKQPYELLPIMIVVTLLLESVMLTTVLKVELKKAFKWICIGNICSFLVPYLFNYGMLNVSMGYESFKQALSTGPYYIVRIGYLLLTLVVEVPIVWSGICKNVNSKKKGISTIVIANILTTALVYIVERFFCKGKW